MKISYQLCTWPALPLRKEIPVPIGYEAEWIPEPIWTLWKGDKPLDSAGN
jgi:hypothetical protein